MAERGRRIQHPADGTTEINAISIHGDLPLDSIFMMKGVRHQHVFGLKFLREKEERTTADRGSQAQQHANFLICIDLTVGIPTRSNPSPYSCTCTGISIPAPYFVCKDHGLSTPRSTSFRVTGSLRHLPHFVARPWWRQHRGIGDDGESSNGETYAADWLGGSRETPFAFVWC